MAEVKGPRLLVEDEQDPTLLREGQLSSAVTWTGAGFTMLVALLGFFGLTGGALDRVLRSSPTSVLWIFVLLGLGVLCSLFAPALTVRRRAYLLGLVVAILMLVLVSWIVYDDIDDAATAAVKSVGAWVVVLIVAALVVWGRDQSLPLPAAALVLGVAATSLGLYGAAKAAVMSTTVPESPRLTAALQGEGAGRSLQLTAQAGKREDRPLVLVVAGVRAAAGTTGDPVGTSVEGTRTELLARVVLAEGPTGEVDSTVGVPIPEGIWRELRIGYCELEREAGVSHLCTAADDAAFQERVRLLPPTDRPLSVDAVLSRTGANGRVVVTAAGAAPGERVHVFVRRLRGTTAVVAEEYLLQPASPSAMTRTSVVPVRTGDRLRVEYVVCTADGCSARRDVAATSTIIGS